MFEKVVIDMTNEDENSAAVLRKCWWYVVALDWMLFEGLDCTFWVCICSFSLPGPLISLTHPSWSPPPLSLSVWLWRHPEQWWLISTSNLLTQFHRCTPVFLTSFLPHGTTWRSHKYTTTELGVRTGQVGPANPRDISGDLQETL